MKLSPVPRRLRIAPRLDPTIRLAPVQRRVALLLQPFYPKDRHGSFGKHVLTPSLALTTVAAATPAHWQVRLWDENLLQGPPPLEPLPQVVGITLHTAFASRGYALAAWYRQHGVIVVFGGLHVSSCPDECAPHADAIAIGDGVQTWPHILADVEAGLLAATPTGEGIGGSQTDEPTPGPSRGGEFGSEIPLLGGDRGGSSRRFMGGQRAGLTEAIQLKPPARVYRSDFRRPYRLDPLPRRGLLDRASFLTTASVIATRGCHNRCGFCYLSTDGLRMPHQVRDPQQVAAELEHEHQPYAVFLDNNLGSRPEYLRELCRALRPLETIWSAAVSVDVTDDPSVVRDMARAGCTGVFVGFETLTDQNLADAHKKTPPVADYARRVQIFHDYGIQVNGSFVLGFDHDRPDCFERTCAWIEAQRLECATFHILTPYPGTPLFRQLQTEGRLLHTNWDLYDTAHVVFRPRHLSIEQLADGYSRCYQRLFSHRSIWRRRPAETPAVLPYLVMSYLYKRANWLWPILIRHRLTGAVWRPLVELTRRRHVRFRRRLAETRTAHNPSASPAWMTARPLFTPSAQAPLARRRSFASVP